MLKNNKKIIITEIAKNNTSSLKERGLSPVDVINKARIVADDEFYTRYEDIEKEITLYPKRIWKNKVVFCNCDSAADKDGKRNSAFALYFLRNFEELKLKKLICTHYSSKVDSFNADTNGYIFTKDGFSKIEDDYEPLKKYSDVYDGSFDHPISLKILNEEADIVCTNPPFSKCIDYWNILIGSGKKFLIISNIINVVTTAYISYFKDSKVWAGYNGVDWFESPTKQLISAAGHWYTNLPIKNRPKYKRLKIMALNDIPEKYKKFDDARTLLADNGFIPNDYDKPFAVSPRPILNGLLEKGYKIVQNYSYRSTIKGNKKFSRILVQKI